MKINSDKKRVNEVRSGLEMNGGYCPCQTDKNEDTKCPCKMLREDKKCICGLYVD